MFRRGLPIALGVLALSLAPALANATPIAWGAATNIAGDADVSTSGALVGAFNLGGPGVSSTTVNGVLFAALPVTGSSVTSGQFTFTNAGGFGTNNSTGSPNPPFTSLSAAYQTLLSSVVGDGDTPSVLTISGLTPGNTYQFEWWSNSFIGDPGTEQTTATDGNAVTLLANTGQGVGQFAIGTFVAGGTGIETISFTNGPNSPDNFLNGFQLRNVGASAVPEPASMVLFGTGLVGLARGWRNRRRRG